MTIKLINADATSAQGLAITSSGSSSWMPMMTTRAAFTGSAIWFLGEPTSAGPHEATMTFTATAAGTYQYLCPVPGHAQTGMAGALIVNP